MSVELIDNNEETQEEQTSGRRTMDPALRLADRMDRLMEECPAWAQEWALAYLVAKYGHTGGRNP